LIWPTIDRVVLSTLVTEINKKIEKTHYSMILSVEPIPKSLETFKRFQVDGIIYFDESFENEIPEMDLPLVIYGVQDPYHVHPVVDPNHAKSMFLDRKSTRLNSSHVSISYAVFCLKKK